MEYAFTRRERNLGRIVFTLTLDRTKMKEHIVIGEPSEVRRRLERGTGEVYYDQTRPLGELLLTFESDAERQWNANAMRLYDSYGTIFPARSAGWKKVKPGADFLRTKYSHGEPSAMFAAIRTWEEYLNCYNINHGPQLFLDRVSLLYRPFVLYGEYRPWQEEASAALSQAIHDGESQVELWYPVKKRPFECVMTISSFQPVIFYYLNRLAEWGFTFQECKVCGRYFPASSKRFAICGDECRKVQALQAKQQFDERTKDNRLEQLHESAYYYWYNRLRKLKRAKDTAPERLAAAQEAFQAFRVEAVRRKTEVKHSERKLSDFASWLAQQQDEADRVMEES